MRPIHFSGKFVLRRASGIGHLLTHTSGLDDRSSLQALILLTTTRPCPARWPYWKPSSSSTPSIERCGCRRARGAAMWNRRSKISAGCLRIDIAHRHAALRADRHSRWLRHAAAQRLDDQSALLVAGHAFHLAVDLEVFEQAGHVQYLVLKIPRRCDGKYPEPWCW